MKIMAPVASIEAAKTYAKMKIEEIYVGVESPPHHNMKHVTFTGRSKTVPGGGIAHLASFDVLKEVVTICHDNNMSVNFTANVRNLPEELNLSYVEYVEGAIGQGVDSIIVGSISALLLLAEKKYGIPLHSSTFFYPFNKYDVDFYKKFGVRRMILPTALRIEELSQIASYIRENKIDMELEVFAHFGCSNINGRCNIFHNPPSVCRGKYDVFSGDNEPARTNFEFIDGGSDCSICALEKLLDNDIVSLKIIGRGLPISVIGSIAFAYREAIDKLKSGKGIHEIRKELLERAPWWEDSFCRENRCFYIASNMSKYYV